MRTYENYHKHSFYSNLRVSDSVVFPKRYAERNNELGHKLLSTVEHGWQGNIIDYYNLAKDNDFKFLVGAEAYWVRDREEKDRTNCHICLLAKNENGRRALNDALSEANISGFYGQPRLDIPLILTLPRDDIWVTTACVAYWKYEDANEITLRFADHFRDNFFLEVQYHNTDSQKSLNENILSLANKYKMPLIMGCDSHYISAKEERERLDYIESKGMRYEDEDGWFMDYPDGDTAYKRFVDQGILSHNNIVEAMDNTKTFLNVEEYDCPCFNKEIKMPTIYPGKSQEEKDKIYDKMIWDAWDEEKFNIDESEWDHYEEEIQKEIDIVHITKHADYFLLNQKLVKLAKEKGGVMTSTGRGSSVSFYTNKLLGLTDVDRIGAQVKMWPERFMSPTRILESKTLADLDQNWATVDIAAKAQEEVVGEGHSYPMIAYGTMKPKAAWKMYAKSQDVPFEIANAVSGQIEKYDRAIARAQDEEKDDIDILDFIDKDYRSMYMESKIYQGIIVSSSIHPCSYLLYDGDIRKEIGLIRAKDTLVCLMDGHWAEDYKFLKNDLLKVSVYSLIDAAYKNAKRRRHTISELLNECTPDNKVWSIYKKGCTLGINQVEQDGTKARVAKYAPKNISELCAFVAAIRPGFKSMYSIFESRKHFDYSIPSLDALLQTPFMPNSFVLYQEQAMAVLNFAGIPMNECYEAIKNIAKKRVEKVLKYKEKFLRGFAERLILSEKIPSDLANSTSEKVWQILEDSSRYSFNASHSYCVALDSLYGAYLKCYYPLEFYSAFLNILQEKGDKDRMNAAKDEAESYFGITFPPYRFRQDNRSVKFNKETNQITNTIAAIKGYSKSVAQILYECGLEENKTFLDVLFWLKEHGIYESKIRPLIEIDYFSEFGNSTTLNLILDAFEFFKRGESKTLKDDNIDAYRYAVEKYASNKNKKGEELKSWKVTDCVALLYCVQDYLNNLKISDIPYKMKAEKQLDVLGYFDITSGKEEDRRKIMVTNIYPLISKNSTDSSVWGYRVFTRSIGSGKSASLTCITQIYDNDPISKGDILYAKSCHKNKDYWYLDAYEVIE